MLTEELCQLQCSKHCLHPDVRNSWDGKAFTDWWGWLWSFCCLSKALAVGIKEPFSILLMGAGLGDTCLDVHPGVDQKRTYCREHA